MQAIILAGGLGTRLRPFTTNFPKPLVPIGDVPILEVVLRQLRHYGFTNVTLAVNHLADLIISYFGDGKKFGLTLNYSRETKILGTAGPLALVDSLEENFLVMNGDLLTTINFGDFYRFHVDRKAEATIATFEKHEKIDLGVLETDGDVFVDYREKPTYHFTVSMGIYMIHKSTLSFLQKDEKMDMPDLLLKLKGAKKKVLAYRGDYSWLDIGRTEDYETAVKLFAEKRGEFLPDE